VGHGSFRCVLFPPPPPTCRSARCRGRQGDIVIAIFVSETGVPFVGKSSIAQQCYSPTIAAALFRRTWRGPLAGRHQVEVWKSGRGFLMCGQPSALSNCRAGKAISGAKWVLRWRAWPSRPPRLGASRADRLAAGTRAMQATVHSSLALETAICRSQ